MIFSRSKKLSRDREAGLVFRWRGGLAGNRGGMTLALILTTGVFALAFVGLNVKVRKTKPPQRRVAKIMMVPENDERLSLWVDQRSPFPARWDPLYDAQHLARVESALAAAMFEESLRDTDWRQLPVTPEQPQIPKIFSRGEQILPDLTKVERVELPEAPVKLELKMEAMGDLSKRLPDILREYRKKIPAGEFGRQYRWFVTVNGRGEVLYVAPVEPGTGDFVDVLETWLRGQDFKASNEEVQTGEIVIRVGRKKNGHD